MNNHHAAPEPPAPEGPIPRLLFVADAAVADVDELPPAVRAVIDAAGEVYVVTPTLPGRLAWLADDIDGFRQEGPLHHHGVVAGTEGVGSVRRSFSFLAAPSSCGLTHRGARPSRSPLDGLSLALSPRPLAGPSSRVESNQPSPKNHL